MLKQSGKVTGYVGKSTKRLFYWDDTWGNISLSLEADVFQKKNPPPGDEWEEKDKPPLKVEVSWRVVK